MLAAERRDPEIISGDGFALLFQFQTDCCVRVSSLLVDVQHKHGSNPFAEPTLVSESMAGLGDSKPVFAQYDHRNGEVFGAGHKLHSRSFAIGNGG